MRDLDKEFLELINYYCGCNQDALAFVLGYSIYVHDIDDIVDGDKMGDIHLLKTFELAAVVYSNPFYIKNINTLYPLIIMSSSTYITSVTLEKDPDKAPWKTWSFDWMRQTGIEVILAVVQILHGIDKRIEASLRFREISFKLHHKEDGTPC